MTFQQQVFRLWRFQLITVFIAIGLVLGCQSAGWAQPRQKSVQPGSGISATMQNLKLSSDRWIEIDLSSQRLFAWEGGIQVYAVVISTGKSSTPTPTGIFSVQSRYRETRMQGEDYDVPDVPYAMFYSGGYAIHGAYWHNSFGTPVSHGCVNVAVDHARWLYNWSKAGTPIVVHH
jgi:lipoprotein-anchoring transpeptidase ErfK/SrfK